MVPDKAINNNCSTKNSAYDADLRFQKGSSTRRHKYIFGICKHGTTIRKGDSKHSELCALCANSQREECEDKVVLELTKAEKAAMEILPPFLQSFNPFLYLLLVGKSAHQ